MNNASAGIRHSIDFNETEQPLWRPLNDNVMGGISRGDILFSKDHARFFGSVSTDFNGGFSSVARETISIPVKTRKVTLRITGDGQQYQFRLIHYLNRYRVAYKHLFETTRGTQQDITLNLSDFVASWRGRTIVDAPKLKPQDVQQISFMAAFKQPKSFELILHKIEFH